MTDRDYLKIAVEQARKSVKAGGFPAGSIVVLNEKIVGEGISIGQVILDPTSHSDIDAIRDACRKLNDVCLAQATLYASLEPCNMCFSAAYWAGIERIVYGYKKTQEMVNKKYYEGSLNNDELSTKNTHKIELVYLPDFISEIVSLIEDWEKKTVYRLHNSI